METINESSLSLKFLMPLLSWVRAQFKLNGPTILHVSNAARGSKMTVGWTGRTSPGRPIIIKLGVLRGQKYPRVTRHVPDIPETTLASIKEEIVLVLAHELRHAHQIELGIFGAMEGYWAEVDAERFAQKILERYRAR